MYVSFCCFFHRSTPLFRNLNPPISNYNDIILIIIAQGSVRFYVNIKSSPEGLHIVASKLSPKVFGCIIINLGLILSAQSFHMAVDHQFPILCLPYD